MTGDAKGVYIVPSDGMVTLRMLDNPMKTYNNSNIAILFIVILGLGYRCWLAAVYYPWTGDPAFSYCYRASLIAHGDFRGIELMWHPPGYPLLLAGLVWAGSHLLSPYAWGIIVSLTSYVALTGVIDRLLVRRSACTMSRVVAAGFLAIDEILVRYATGPLTEPPYLLLIYFSLLILDQERVANAGVIIAGLLLRAYPSRQAL